MKNRLLVLGIILVILGLGLASTYYYRSPASITAVGLSTAILGLTCIFLSGDKTPVYTETWRIMMKTGIENTSELLAELDIKNKAIYLPRDMRGGHHHALMPLTDDNSLRKIKDSFPGHLIIRSLPGAEMIAIAVTTPGNISLDMLPQSPGPTAGEIQKSVTYILTRMMESVPAVKVDLKDSRINIEVRGSKLDFENALFYECLGSPIASVAAAVSSEALLKPVRIINENNDKSSQKIQLEVLN